jgi:hypothetical protein
VAPTPSNYPTHQFCGNDDGKKNWYIAIGENFFFFPDEMPLL